MPKVSEVYGGAYLTGADLAGKSHRLTIDTVAVEEIGDQRERKLVVSFSGAKKSLVLNKTNASTLVGSIGDDADSWTGRTVELFTVPVTFNGRTYDGVRVRAASDSPAPTPKPVGMPAAQTRAASQNAAAIGEDCPF